MPPGTLSVSKLTEYEHKRKFDLTPEPRGKTQGKAGNRFVVQEHHARRLHYDFRLEVAGVLASWAVPKGPSMDPADKRLAIQTEDHPLEYGKFEGVIPAGNYGAGQVSIWDEGTYEMEGKLSAQEQIDRGELKFVLHGRKLKGSFVLVKIHGRERGSNAGREWLLIKHADDSSAGWKLDPVATGSNGANGVSRERPAPVSSHSKRGQMKLEMPAGGRKAPMPEMIRPALAVLVDKPFSSADWLFEIKWDGVRTLARVKNGKSRLRSRSAREITQEYPEMADLAEQVNTREAWLDGEIVVLDSDGRSDFQRLQARFGVQRPSKQLIESTPTMFYIFDIVYVDGYDLHKVPLIERKELLRKVVREDARIRYSDHVLEKGEELYKLAVARNLEGLVAKRIDSPYHEGRSSRWLKIKLDVDISAVVGGWTAPRGSREYFGALLLGLYDENRELQFIGGVGTGFTRETQRLLWPKVQKLKTQKCPFAEPPSTREERFWIKPELVARVKFSSWTQDRHLRAPRYEGLQDDRPGRDCTFEKEMKQAVHVEKQAGTAKVETDSGPEMRSERKRPVKTDGRGKSKHPAARRTQTKPERDSLRPSSNAPVLASDDEIQEELDGGSAENVQVEIDGRVLQLTNLNKVYFPEDEFTKRDLLGYYFRMAPLILPFLMERPMVLRRYPNGIRGKTFFQKDAAKETPEWVQTATIHSDDKNKPIRYILANDRTTLIYLTNLGCIDHNPWSSTHDNQEHPDYIFFDLDPTPETPFSTVVKLGKLLLEALENLGMTAFTKTSGATGLHIFLPVEPRYTFEQARMFVDAVASIVDKQHKGLITFERSVSNRPNGRIYMDSHQNSRGQSLASVYSVRAFPHGPVSAPVKPSELTASLDPVKWNLKTMKRRLETVGDLWADFWEKRQRLEKLLER
ncbi:MAG TPA: DNA ligase D [Candidatus Acidoferrales bacterium]|jgi:bifunctional non-homologous end joining protein LigD|nr:DNA ligase D [Candidatus Acidoferrales bacterium]